MGIKAAIRRGGTKAGASLLRILHFLFPPTTAIKPTRDSVEDEYDRLRIQREVVRGSIAWLPIAGVLAISVNVLVQFGSVQAALAVVQRQTLANLVFIVTLNLLTYLILGTALGLSVVVGDRSYAPHVRSVAVAAQIVAVFIAVFAFPFATTGFLLLLIYLAWRRQRSSRKARPAKNESDGTAWYKTSTYPIDAKLRALWLEGRQILRSNNVDLPSSVADTLVLEPHLPRTFGEVNREAFDRAQEIVEASQTKDALNAIFAVCIGIVASYGLVAINTPIHFAPLEKVHFQSQNGDKVGYLLGDPANPSLFVSSDARTITILKAGSIQDRELCQAKPDWLGMTFRDSLLSAAGRTAVVDCNQN
ncbi:hypothetical protein [Leifsonia sp. P73]|uniref:hypothetical protein n=1 Tax=Leifsonia sp. P73 TaxID=3423959 RepID=UPI003DA4D76C